MLTFAGGIGMRMVLRARAAGETRVYYVSPYTDFGEIYLRVDARGEYGPTTGTYVERLRPWLDLLRSAAAAGRPVRLTIERLYIQSRGAYDATRMEVTAIAVGYNGAC